MGWEKRDGTATNSIMHNSTFFWVNIRKENISNSDRDSETNDIISEPSSKCKNNKEITIISAHPNKIIQVNTIENINSENGNLRLKLDIKSTIIRVRHKNTTLKNQKNKKVASFTTDTFTDT